MSLIRYQGPQGVAWPALGRLSNLWDELDSLFELPFLTNFGNPSQLFSGWTPALDLYQSKDNVTAVVELPGMRKEDIEISLHDDMLTISGERKQQIADDNKAERSERYVGKFRRSVSLPTRVDMSKVSANYKEGLEISVENNELTILGRRSLPTVDGTVIHRESRTNSFRRTFELDPSIDTGNISAKIEQGVVTLTLPKAEQVKPRKIQVS